jgi:NitT/TauT family transport system substrate-binding protein
MVTMKKVAVIIAVSWAVFATTLMAADPGPVHVTFLPQWFPQAQFAGYMMALEKGFYKEAGLDVKILRGGPSNPPLEALIKGKTIFCSSWVSSAVQMRSSGAKLVNLAQVVQRSALMLVTRKSSGIKTLQDLDGKRIGLWQGDFKIQPLALFRLRNLNVIQVPMYGSINLLLRGAVDAATAMWYNEYHTLLNKGFEPEELTTFFFSDYGLNFPEDGIYCLETTWDNQPGTCENFVQASIRGWLYAFENQGETLDVVMKYAEEALTGTNRAQQAWMLARMQELIIPNGTGESIGKLDIRQYELVVDILQELGLISNKPDFKQFYRGKR